MQTWQLTPGLGPWGQQGIWVGPEHPVPTSVSPLGAPLIPKH